ncbi:MAG: hypothetical protein IPM89_08380 [Candidatus Competibacteraceae bacterium]|nr:MAG: hypothetical protein IPM89_08380 [Candidatus Competibacteraceae bacterium]
MMAIRFFQYSILMARTLSGYIAAAIVVTLSIGVSQAMTSETQSPALSSLRSTSGTELENLVEHYLNQREADVRELMDIVGGQESIFLKSQRVATKSKDWFSITLLGDIKATAAAPLLARLITIRDTSFSLVSDEGNPHWYSFPAAVALSKIGLPAVEPLLDLTRTAPPASTAFHLGAVTLEAILGEELAIFAAQQYARDHSDFSQPDRLAALTTLIRTGHQRWTAHGASDFSPE